MPIGINMAAVLSYTLSKSSTLLGKGLKIIMLRETSTLKLYIHYGYNYEYDDMKLAQEEMASKTFILQHGNEIRMKTKTVHIKLIQI